MSSSPKPTIIDGDHAEYASWQPPSIQKPTAKDIAEQERQRLITAESIEVLQKQAFEEGYSQGFQKGIQDAESAIQERLRNIDSIAQFLQKPLQEVDEAVIEQLSQLAISIARKLIRREIKTDPGQIVAVVRETVSALPAGIQNIRVFMNPDDAAVLRESMNIADGDKSWTIVEEPLLSKGGCKVLTDYSEIDASVEARLSGIIARMLGGERQSDRGAEE